MTAAIVVKARVAPGQVDREISCLRAEAARPPWIRGLVAQLPVKHASALAALPHVHCKLSGLATEVRTASRCEVVATRRAALDAFGSGRCLYGGAWPVCTLATSPNAWPDVVLAALDQAGASGTEREDVLTRSAHRTHRLRPIAAAPSEGARR